MVNMKRIDYIIIIFNIIAAMLTAMGIPFGCLFFVFSSTIGLIDGVKHKATTAAIVNSIFLALNIYFTIKLVISLF